MNKETKQKTAAEKLAEDLRPTLPPNYECSECLMINMFNPSGNCPEMVMISPKKEHYRAHRLAKTLPTLREEVKALHDQWKLKGGNWRTITRDGCTIYLRPNE